MQTEFEHGFTDKLQGSLYLNAIDHDISGVPGTTDRNQTGFNGAQVSVKYNLRSADRVRAWAPGGRVGYSVRTERQLRAYLAGRETGVIPETAVAVRHTLLHTADEVAVLRERARRVNAWTVDDVDRAMQLVSWGVDEITSNHVTVLNAL